MKLPKGWRLSSRRTLIGASALAVAVLVAGYFTLHHTSGTEQPVKQKSQSISVRGNLLDKQWSYMPGVSRSGETLKVSPLNFAIVEQDGSGGQSNPPVNLYGVHLEDAGDFRISASVAKTKDTAALQFYGAAPLIADEFRIEPKSLRLTVAKDSLRTEIWDGNAQQPVDNQVFPLDTRRPVDIGFIHRGSELEIRANGKSLATINDRGIFSDHKVWFGLDGTSTWELIRFAAEPVDGGKLSIADSSTLTAAQDPDGLQALASKKRPGFLIGAAMALGPAATDQPYASVAFGGNFGSLTPENAMKWQFIHPAPDTYSFQQADALVDLASRNHVTVHGHALVFGEANPSWVNGLPVATAADKEHVRQVMLGHIGSMVGHYKGKVASWDVINEPLADYDDFDMEGRILRNHKWYQAMGEDYIAQAFRKAREADPNALLFMNDYGLEADDERWDAMLALVTRLKKQGVPIDGVGFQSHVYEEGDRIPTSSLRHHMQQLAKIGLKARISEIDVYAWGGSQNQASQYTEALKACLAEANCVSYTTWGISDRYNTYKEDSGAIAFGEDFLWDTAMKPTLAVTRMKEALRQ